MTNKKKVTKPSFSLENGGFVVMKNIIYQNLQERTLYAIVARTILMLFYTCSARLLEDATKQDDRTFLSVNE